MHLALLTVCCLLPQADPPAAPPLAAAMRSRGEGRETPKQELLWPKGAPGAVGMEAADKPSLTVYLPPAGKANGTAVVICPGGGYGFLAVDHEGKQVAEWFNNIGVAAF